MTCASFGLAEAFVNSGRVLDDVGRGREHGQGTCQASQVISQSFAPRRVNSGASPIKQSPVKKLLHAAYAAPRSGWLARMRLGLPFPLRPLRG